MSPPTPYRGRVGGSRDSRVGWGDRVRVRLSVMSLRWFRPSLIYGVLDPTKDSPLSNELQTTRV